MERQLALLVRLIDDLLDVARITRGKLELRRSRPRCSEVLHVGDRNRACPLIEHGGHRAAGAVAAAAACRCMPTARGCRRCSPTCSTTPPSIPTPGGEIVLAADARRTTASRVQRARPRHRPERRTDSSDIFELFTPGRHCDRTRARRPGHRPDAGATAGRNAWRRGQRAQRRPRPAAANSSCSLPLRIARRRCRRPPTPIARGAAVARPERHRAPGGRRQPRCRRYAGDDAGTAWAWTCGACTTRMQVEAAFESFAPDVVFLDVGMPGRSGYDVAAHCAPARASHRAAGRRHRLGPAGRSPAQPRSRLRPPPGQAAGTVGDPVDLRATRRSRAAR